MHSLYLIKKYALLIYNLGVFTMQLVEYLTLNNPELSLSEIKWGNKFSRGNWFKMYSTKIDFKMNWRFRITIF